MTMLKRKILFIAFFACFLGSTQMLQAQTSANATLNVVLSDVRSIKVNPAQATVTLNFANVTDYNNGVSSTQNAHLEVTSTGGYIIKVKSSTPNLVNGTNQIPVNTVTLTPLQSSGGAVGTSTSAVGRASTLIPVNLGATATTIISSTDGATKIFYDMTYRASGGAPYINKASGTYTTTITYTIEPL
jgi:hypothetical protein